MSRTGWSSTNFMRGTTLPVSAAPLTISAWGYTSIAASNTQDMVGLYKSSATGNIDCFRLALDVSAVIFQANNGSASGTATTSQGPSTNTWFHAAGVQASATSRAAYFNGGFKGTDTLSRTPAGIDRASIGKRDNVSSDNNFGRTGTGYLADVAMWNVALTDAEILSLSLGFSPLLVRPSGLVFYSPLYGVGSNEPNLINSAAEATINGTLTQGIHPPIIMPRRPLITL